MTNQDIPPYEALNFDGLERRANYRTVAYREDVLKALGKRDAAAIIWGIIYRWQTEYKRAEVLKEIERRKKLNMPPLTEQEVEDMLFVYMSYNDFVRESGGALGYNTVIRAIDYLIYASAIIQRKNSNPRYPDYEYSIDKEQMRALLQALPVNPIFTPKIPKKRDASTQMGTLPLQTRSTQMGTEVYPNGYTTSTQMGTEVYPNGGTSHNYSQNHSTENTQRGNGDDAHAHRTPAPLSSLQATESESLHASGNLAGNAALVDNGRPPVQHEPPLAQAQPYSDSQPATTPSQWLSEEPPLREDELSTEGVDNSEDEGDDAPTLYRMPAMRPTTSPIPVTQAIGDDDASNHPSGTLELHGAGGHLRDDGDGARGTVGMAQVDATRLADTLSSGSAAPCAVPDTAASTPSGTPGSTQSVPAMPPVVGAKRRKTNAPARAVKKDEPPLLCETVKVRMAIIAFRGFALEVAGEIINENKGIKVWCEGHTEDELQYVMERLPSDAFWGQADKRQFFRVQHFINKASALLAKRVVRESARSDVPDFLRPDGSISDYAAYAIWKAHHSEPLEFYLSGTAAGQAMGV